MPILYSLQKYADIVKKWTDINEDLSEPEFFLLVYIFRINR